MSILPLWAAIVYFVVLFAILILTQMYHPTPRRPIRRASRLWAPGPPTRIPRQRPLLATAPPPPAPAPPTVPLTLPDDTIPLAVVGPDDMIRPHMRKTLIPTPPDRRMNGHLTICPLCGGGSTSGRILLPGRPGCIWCAPRAGGTS